MVPVAAMALPGSLASPDEPASSGETMALGGGGGGAVGMLPRACWSHVRTAITAPAASPPASRPTTMRVRPLGSAGATTGSMGTFDCRSLSRGPEGSLLGSPTRDAREGSERPSRCGRVLAIGSTRSGAVGPTVPAGGVRITAGESAVGGITRAALPGLETRATRGASSLGAASRVLRSAGRTSKASSSLNVPCWRPPPDIGGAPLVEPPASPWMSGPAAPSASVRMLPSALVPRGFLGAFCR